MIRHYLVSVFMVTFGIARPSGDGDEHCSEEQRV
jgi:hypothetical protein